MSKRKYLFEAPKGYRKRYKKILRDAKPKIYSTSNGDVYLNPVKRALTGKKYINPEYEYIMNNEIKSAIEALNTYDVPEGGNKVD